jgi:hypothetical protein
MQSLTQGARPESSDNSVVTNSPLGGRRRGDAILIAFNHAFDRGDVDVAAQLLVEYQKINEGSPLSLSVERRRNQDNVASTVSRLWARLRTGFAS